MKTILLPLWMVAASMFRSLDLTLHLDGASHSRFYNLWFEGKAFSHRRKYPTLILSVACTTSFFELAKEDWNGVTWNDVKFPSSNSIGESGEHTSNDPAQSFSGPNWYQVVNNLNGQVAVKRINTGGDPTIFCNRDHD